jgi:hypothetical protein
MKQRQFFFYLIGHIMLEDYSRWQINKDIDGSVSILRQDYERESNKIAERGPGKQLQGALGGV